MGRRSPHALALGFGAQFGSTQLGGQAIQHAIDVFVPIRSPKTLGQLHGFVDDHAIGHIEALAQLEAADEQGAVLNGREFFGGSVHMGGKQGIKGRRFADATVQKQLKVLLVALGVTGLVAQVGVNGPGIVAGEEPLVQALQGNLARLAPRRSGGGFVSGGVQTRLSRHSAQAAQQRGHFNGHLGSVAALVDSCPGLGLVFNRKDDVGDGQMLVQRHAADPGAAFVGHEFEVVGLAADDAAQGDQGVDLAFASQGLQGQGDLQGATDVHHRHHRGAQGLESLNTGVAKRGGDAFIETCAHHGHTQAPAVERHGTAIS